MEALELAAFLRNAEPEKEGDFSLWAKGVRLAHEWNPFKLRSHRNHYELVADSMATAWGTQGCNCGFCVSLREQFILGSK